MEVRGWSNKLVVKKSEISSLTLMALQHIYLAVIRSYWVQPAHNMYDNCVKYKISGAETSQRVKSESEDPVWRSSLLPEPRSFLPCLTNSTIPPARLHFHLYAITWLSAAGLACSSQDERERDPVEWIILPVYRREWMSTWQTVSSTQIWDSWAIP